MILDLEGDLLMLLNWCSQQIVSSRHGHHARAQVPPEDFFGGWGYTYQAPTTVELGLPWISWTTGPVLGRRRLTASVMDPQLWSVLAAGILSLVISGILNSLLQQRRLIINSLLRTLCLLSRQRRPFLIFLSSLSWLLRPSINSSCPVFQFCRAPTLPAPPWFHAPPAPPWGSALSP